MADQLIEDLRRAAAARDVAALTQMGERLLDSDLPGAVGLAADALDRATQAGGVEAPARLAMMFAMGAGMIQNWTAALDLLRIGAERGSRSAREQLQVLAGLDAAWPGEAADGPDRWKRLRDSIDIGAWTGRTSPEVVCGSPRIYRLDRFISPAVCEWIIARGAGRHTRALVYDPLAPDMRVDEVRTNSTISFKLSDLDAVMAMLRIGIAAVVGVDPSALEPTQLLHYKVGERFGPHFDFLEADLPGHVKDLAEHGQRIATFLIYLNDDFDGGETDFPIVGQRHKPPAGGALWFANTQSSGTPDRRTLHAGLAPTRGEKWLLSQWIRKSS